MPMIRLVKILAIVLAVALAACERSPLADARARVELANVEQIRYEAARIYKQVHAIPGPEYVVLKPAQWPGSFKTLKPMRVGVYRDGFAFALGGEADKEWGIHIVPTGMASKRPAAAAKFEKLAEGAYFYALGQ